MSRQPTLSETERRRNELRAKLAEVGDMRPGSLAARGRKCGKPNCHCAAEGAPGHEGWILTREVQGRTVTRSIPAVVVEQTKAQVAEYRRFRELTRELVEVSDRLCEARLGETKAEAEATAKKGGSKRPSKPRSARNSKRS